MLSYTRKILSPIVPSVLEYILRWRRHPKSARRGELPTGSPQPINAHLFRLTTFRTPIETRRPISIRYVTPTGDVVIVCSPMRCHLTRKYPPKQGSVAPPSTVGKRSAAISHEGGVMSTRRSSSLGNNTLEYCAHMCSYPTQRPTDGIHTKPFSLCRSLA